MLWLYTLGGIVFEVVFAPGDETDLAPSVSVTEAKESDSVSESTSDTERKMSQNAVEDRIRPRIRITFVYCVFNGWEN